MRRASSPAAFRRHRRRRRRHRVHHPRLPVEGTEASVAAELWQDADGVVRGRTDAPAELLPALIRQASRSLSLDHDGTGWPAVGDRDPLIGGLQREYDYLRPVCFYSAYEAATSFVIGQRISRRQSATIKRDSPSGSGIARPSPGRRCPPFPGRRGCSSCARHGGSTPRRCAGCTVSPPPPSTAGWTRRSSAPRRPADALAALQALPGVGPFTANGVLYRGCGLADGLPGADELGKDVIRDLYGIDAVTGADVERMAEAWRPYRMWAVVLLRMAWTRRSGGEVSYRR